MATGQSYTIAETPTNPWALQSVSCQINNGTPFSPTITNNAITLDPLGSTDEAVCTFTNQLAEGPQARLRLVKRLDPDSDDGRNDPEFNFEIDGSSGPSLRVGEETTFIVEPATDITVEELAPPANWTLTDVDCGNDENPATVQVPEGETVTCTFTNRFDRDVPPPTPTGSIEVKKVTIGGDGLFKFTVTGQASFSLKNGQDKRFNNLPVGAYTIREANLPKGWELQNVSCNKGGKRTKNGINVSLGDGDVISCTFTNFKKEDEQMEDLTKLFVHRRVDNLLTYGPGRGRILRRLQEQPIIPLKGGGPLKYSDEAETAASEQSQTPAPYALGYGAVQAPQRLGQSATQTPPALGHSPLQMPQVQGGGLYNNGGYGQASSLMPGSGLDSRSDALGLSSQPQQSTGILPSLAAQFVPLSQGGQNFKFSTSLSEMRSAATQAEAQSQKQKLNEAGMDFTSYPYLNPYQEIRPGFDIWVEGQFIHYDDDTGGIDRDGDFSVLYFGADYLLAPGVLVGAIFQLDWTDEDINDPSVRGEIDGTGWMAGPYIGLQLTDFLFFDARAAWGTSDNDIWATDAAAGKRSGDFDTDRWLASASLTGTHTFGGAWRISPQIGINYGSESFDDYRNSLSQIVRGSDTEIGRLRGGAELGYRMQTSGGTIVEPTVSLEGLWNFDDDEFTVGGVPVDFDEGRAKLEGGVTITTPSGWSFRGAGIYDGIGTSDFDAYGGQFWLSVPLN
ncbi:MAG TPA: autotransporter domain-containing protein [Sedimentisphaerales bacterium]|nr:autotransporter domain-containing protein [Sedimentisphaerales bacterium]